MLEEVAIDLQVFRDYSLSNILDISKELKEEYQNAKDNEVLNYASFIPFTKYETDINMDLILWLDKYLEPEERELFSNLALKYLYLQFDNIFNNDSSRLIHNAFVRYVFECVSEYKYSWLVNKYLTFKQRKLAAKRIKDWCIEVDRLLAIYASQIVNLFFIRYINGKELTICYI